MSRPFVFLDRDGTLIEDRAYAFRPEDCVLLPSVTEALTALRGAGFGLVVVTNQSGVARGYFDAADLQRFHARLTGLLAEASLALDGIYVCPHHPDARCRCRKPAPGLVEQACAEHAVDLPASWVVGDKRSDADLAGNVGCRAVWLRPDDAPLPDGCLAAPDLAEAARLVIASRLSRSSARPPR